MAGDSASLVPKDERELNLGAEIGTGAVLPGGKLTFSYRRKWDHRGDQFLAQTLENARADEDELLARIEGNESFADAFAAAGQKAVLSGDEMTRDWLARLIAAAFDDDSKVDTVAFLVNLLTQLEPVHLRVLNKLRFNPRNIALPVTAASLARLVGAEPVVAYAALQRLSSMHLVAPAKQDFVPDDEAKRGWDLTSIGTTMLELCARHRST